MSTTDLTQLMTALTTLVAGLGGVMAFVGARLSRRQRDQADELRDLRSYIALVTRWGFRLRVMLAANGLDAPPMPELGDTANEDTERTRPAAPAPERPISQLAAERAIGRLTPDRADPRTALAPGGGAESAPAAVQRSPAAAETARHRLRDPDPGEDWPLPRERRTHWD